MSTDDNINAGISVLVDTDMSLDHLDGILTTLRKHGLSPRYFEYDEKLDTPKDGYWKVETPSADDEGTTDEPEGTVKFLYKSDFLSYDSDQNLTTITATRVYEGKAN